MNETLKAGDLVVLKSGGPVMTYAPVPSLTCFWFRGDQPMEANIPNQALRLATADDVKAAIISGPIAQSIHPVGIS